MQFRMERRRRQYDKSLYAMIWVALTLVNLLIYALTILKEEFINETKSFANKCEVDYD